VLRLADAATWELFDRSDLGASRSARALWELAAILAAVLILLDVAWRRIAFDARDARELAQRVTGGAASAGTGGVDALRRARTGAAAGGSGPSTAGGGASGGVAAGTRFEASADSPKMDARPGRRDARRRHAGRDAAEAGGRSAGRTVRRARPPARGPAAGARPG
jgi:hypothetical protein